jgi:pyruvate dehydrogenase E2 component (dihydrolipoamide acetyltransferase)
MVTVEEADSVSAFANYKVGSSASQSSAPKTEDVILTQQPTPVQTPITQVATEIVGGRVVASPLARRLAREALVDVAQVAGKGLASGPHGRVIGADVLQAIASGALSDTSTATPVQQSSSEPSSSNESIHGDVYTNFQENTSSSSVSSVMGSLYAQSKKEVPHYYLSVEVDVSRALEMKHTFGDSNDISLQDILVKAAAKAMEKVFKYL